MTLTPAQRQQRRRQKLKQQEAVSVRLSINHQLYTRLKKAAAQKEIGFHGFLIQKLAAN